MAYFQVKTTKKKTIFIVKISWIKIWPKISFKNWFKPIFSLFSRKKCDIFKIFDRFKKKAALN